MSDNINISGAHFDNNMPQWATEHTLRRLAQQIDKNHNLDRRQKDKMQRLMEGIAQKLSNQTDNSKKLESKLDELNRNLLAQTKAIKESGDKTKQAAKESASGAATSGSSSSTKKAPQLDTSSLENTLKQSHRSINNMNSTLDTLSQTFTRNSKASTDAILSVREALLGKIGDLDTASASIGSQPSGTKAARVPSQARKKRHKISLDDSGLTDSIEDTNDKIGNILETFKRLETERTGQTPVVGTESIDRIRELSIQAKESAGAMNKMKKGAAMGAGALGKLDRGVGRLLKPVAALSAVLTKFAMLSAAFSAGKEMIWDAQQDIRKAMHETGVAFTQFNTDIGNMEENVRMDGIRLRRMIHEAGLLAEDGLELVRKNAVLMNRMGTEGFFGAIDDIAGDARDMESFMNQMMMSRDKVAEFTAEYLSSLIRIGDMQRMNEEQRVQYTQDFIQDASAFSRVVGEGIGEITRRLLEGREDDRMRLIQMTMTEEQMQNFEMGRATITSLDVGDDVRRIFEDGMFDRTGAGMFAAEGGAEVVQTLNRLNDGLGNRMNDLITQLGTGEVTQEEMAHELIEMRQAIIDGEVSEEEVKALLASGDKNQQQAANVLTGIQALNEEQLQAIKSGEVTAQEAFSELSAGQQVMEASVEASKAFLQEQKAAMFDTESSRESALRAFETGVTATEWTDQAVGFLSSIAKSVLDFLPRIFDTIAAIRDSIARIVNRFGGSMETQDQAEQRRRSERARTTRTDLAGSVDTILGEEYDGGRTIFGRPVLNPEEQERQSIIESNLKQIGIAAGTDEDSAAWDDLRERGMTDDQIREQISQFDDLMKRASERYDEEFVQGIEKDIDNAMKEVGNYRLEERLEAIFEKTDDELVKRKRELEAELQNIRGEGDDSINAIPIEHDDMTEQDRIIRNRIEQRKQAMEEEKQAIVEDRQRRQVQERMQALSDSGKADEMMTQFIDSEGNVDNQAVAAMMSGQGGEGDASSFAEMIETLKNIERGIRENVEETRDSNIP